MNGTTKDLARKFCEELRSGNHKQGFGAYTEKGTVCAKELLRMTADEASHFDLDTDPVSAPIARSVYVVGGKKRGLVGLNDVEKMPFVNIANLVENKFDTKES